MQLNNLYSVNIRLVTSVSLGTHRSKVTGFSTSKQKENPDNLIDVLKTYIMTLGIVSNNYLLFFVLA